MDRATHHMCMGGPTVPPPRGPDHERVARLVDALGTHAYDALIVALPTNVLMVSGYWPVVGTACAVAARDGRVAVIAPEDERELAERGWADPILALEAPSLDALPSTVDQLRGPLRDALTALGAPRKIAVERGACVEPASYAAMHRYGDALPELIRTLSPRAAVDDAGEMLAELRATLTTRELARVAEACAVAGRAFDAGARALAPGVTETDAAMRFRAPLATQLERVGAARADGFAFCMSGPESARAFGSHARSTARRIERGDLVLVHCNSYVDGYWTDITRTYCTGEPTEEQRAMYAAIGEARRAALDEISPGVCAAKVDAAAREVLRERGLGDAFRHATGHGVGFAAIDHDARPRLHPASGDVLERGMVFNVEPGVYLRDQGMRHCDVVALTERGAEVLTPFHGSLEELVRVPGGSPSRRNARAARASSGV
jgi:Xaa-Pro aminopeptidase